MATIAQDVLKSCPLVLPPLSEQEKLLHWIDTECVQVEAAIEAAQREIGLLREYRTRLIADVVTGKLDVRSRRGRTAGGGRGTGGVGRRGAGRS